MRWGVCPIVLTYFNGKTNMTKNELRIGMIYDLLFGMTMTVLSE